MSSGRYRSRKKIVNLDFSKYLIDQTDLEKYENNLIDLDAFFFSKIESYNLEIGCGNGHFLLKQALSNRNSFFLGCELKKKIIIKAIKKIENHKLTTVKFLRGDILNFLEYLPAKIENVYINFPDPWPKKRHHKRRLIQQPFLVKIHSLMLKTARLYFVTDNIDYRDFAIMQIKESNLFESLVENFGYLTRLENYPDTLYASVFRRENKSIYYMIYSVK